MYSIPNQPRCRKERASVIAFTRSSRFTYPSLVWRPLNHIRGPRAVGDVLVDDSPRIEPFQIAPLLIVSLHSKYDRPEEYEEADNTGIQHSMYGPL